MKSPINQYIATHTHVILCHFCFPSVPHYRHSIPELHILREWEESSHYLIKLSTLHAPNIRPFICRVTAALWLKICSNVPPLGWGNTDETKAYCRGIVIHFRRSELCGMKSFLESNFGRKCHVMHACWRGSQNKPGSNSLLLGITPGKVAKHLY